MQMTHPIEHYRARRNAAFALALSMGLVSLVAFVISLF